MTVIKAQHIILSKYATFDKEINYDYDSPDSNFKLVDIEYNTEDAANLLKPDQLLIKTLYLSNDPAQKGWFTSAKSYIAPPELNTPAPARGIGQVVKSTSEKFPEGSFIQGKVNWTTHNIIDVDSSVFPVDPTKVPSLSNYLSALGSTALTAYFAAFKYSGIKPEDEGKVWLITGAAGAVGSFLIHLLVRLYKPKKIIAVAGGAEKVKFVESLGSQVVGVDYRSSTYDEDFEKALNGDEINVFVDHVGGDLLNKAIRYLATFGKIVQVGAISTYNNAGSKFNFSNYSAVVVQRLTIQGFVIVDDIPEFPQAIGFLANAFGTGKLDITQIKETVVDATGDKFKDVPELWTGLFKGQNTGKFITKVADY